MNKQRSIRFRRLLTLFLVICLSLPGTVLGMPIGGKGKKNFNQGMKYEVAQQWDLAAQEFAAAVGAEPGNPEYRLHLHKALTNASLMFMKRGDDLLEQNDPAGAYNAYRQVVAYDPTNDLAKIKMEQIVAQQKAAAMGLQPAKVSRGGNVEDSKVIEMASTSAPRQADLMQNIVYREMGFKTLASQLARQLGLNVIMDESVKDAKVALNLENTTTAKALDYLLLMSKHAFEQIDRRTLFIYQDNPTNRQRFERLMFKTFYLNNASPDDVTKFVTQMLIGTSKSAVPLKDQKAVLVRASQADMQVVQNIIGMLDKTKPEVVIDVEIYEVSQSNLTQIGNQLATSAGQITSPAVTKEFTVNENGINKTVTETTPATNTLIPGLGGLGGFMANPAAAVAAGLLGAKIGSFGFLGLPPSTLSLLQSKGNSKLLARTQIHALDGEANETKVGQKVPVSLGSQLPGLVGIPQQTTTTTTTAGAVGAVANQLGGLGGFSGLGGFGGGFGFNSIQYQDVGLVIKVTPTIANDGNVQIKMDLTSSGVQQGATAEERLTPIFTQRSLSTIARIPDGRTSVVAGVTQQSEGNKRTSVPVLGMVPILGRLFTTPQQDSSTSDIIITVTPHIIRSAGIEKDDHLAHFIGSLGGGNRIAIEEVVNRAQEEEEQERRIIAAQRGNQEQQVVTAAPADSALIQTATAPNYNPTPRVETYNGQIPTPQPQLASNGLTQPQKIGQPVNFQAAPLPTATPAVANQQARPQVQQANAPGNQQPRAMPAGGNFVSGASGTGSATAAGSEAVPEDMRQYIPEGPAEPVKPATLAPARVPEQIEKMRREAATRRGGADTAKSPAQMREEQQKLKDMEQQYLKNGGQPPASVKPAAVQPTPAPATRPVTKPDSEQPGAETSQPPAETANSVRVPAANSPGASVVGLSMMPAAIRGQVGKSFILVLSLDGEAQMTGANISLKYDPAKLQVKAVRDGGLLGKRPDITHQVDGGNLLISMQQADREGPIKASGRLLIVEFTALSNGNTTIDINNGETHLLLAGAPGAQISAVAAQVQIGGEVAARLTNEK